MKRDCTRKRDFTRKKMICSFCKINARARLSKDECIFSVQWTQCNLSPFMC